MASAFSHALVAVALGESYARSERGWRFWVLLILCSILPDADIVGFAFGIEYGDMLGHRGLTHSLAFALLTGCLVVLLAYKDVAPFSKRWWALSLLFFVVTASHGLLDAMTNGGLGVAFFSPFDGTRYFLPWRPIEVSPIGIDPFFSSRGVEVLKSEMVWIWIPSLFFMLIVRSSRRLLGTHRVQRR